MVRIKRGNVARKRRKKVLRIAKGFRGTHSRLFRVANAQVMKALKYAYVGRKQKKRTCLGPSFLTTGFLSTGVGVGCGQRSPAVTATRPGRRADWGAAPAHGGRCCSRE